MTRPKAAPGVAVLPAALHLGGALVALVMAAATAAAITIGDFTFNGG